MTDEQTIAADLMLPWGAAHTAAADACALAVRTALLEAEDGALADDVRPCGSYWLRTQLAPALPPAPLAPPTADPVRHVAVYQADLVATIPTAACSRDDVADGRYFARRHAHAAACASALARDSAGRAAVLEAVDRATVEIPGLVASGLVPWRGSSGPAAGSEKDVLVVAFGGDDSALRIEIRVHFCPALVPASVSGAKPLAPRAAVAELGESTPSESQCRAAGTAAYASAVVEDVQMASVQEKHHATLGLDAAFANSVRLFKAWSVAAGLAARPVAVDTAALAAGRPQPAAGASLDAVDAAGAGLAPCGGSVGWANGFAMATLLMHLRVAGAVPGAGAQEESVLRAAWSTLSTPGTPAGAGCWRIKPSELPADASAETSPALVAAVRAAQQQLVLPIEGCHLSAWHRAAHSGNLGALVTALTAAAGDALLGDGLASAFTPLDGLVRSDDALSAAIASTSRAAAAARRFDAVFLVDSLKGAAFQLPKRRCAGEFDDERLMFTAQARAAAAVTAVVDGALAGRLAGTPASGMAALPAVLATAAAVVVDVDLACRRAIVGVGLVSEVAARSRLVRGPALEAPADQRAAFDRFWGASETSTRQFADGAVCRCFVLPATSLIPGGAAIGLDRVTPADVDTAAAVGNGSVVVPRLLLFAALQRHCGGHVDLAERCDAALDSLVEPDATGAVWADPAADPLCTARRRKAMTSVKQLVASIATTGLPCGISSIDFVSLPCRDTAPFPPVPHAALVEQDAAAAPFGSATVAALEPLHAVLTLADGRKIPDSLEAIAAIKGALVAQLARLASGDAGGLNPGGKRFAAYCPTEAAVDIVCREEGLVCRLHLAHYREVSLRRALNQSAVADALERRLFVSSLHNKYMTAVVGRAPSVAAACRLLIRWAAAAPLVGEYVLPEALELIVAAAYAAADPSAAPGARQAPRTPGAGFLAALALIAQHDFGAHPLVLPGVNSSAAVSNFAMAKRGGEIGMFIASPYTPPSTTGAQASPFTAVTPRPLLMDRLVAAARRAIATISSADASPDALCAKWRAAFSPDVLAFDALMPVAPSALPFAWRSLAPAAAAGDAAAPLGAFALDAEPDTPAPSRGTVRRRCVWHLPPPAGDQEPLAPEVANRLAAVVERDPAADVVRRVRAAVRDDALVFADSFAPEAVGVVLLRRHPEQTVDELEEAVFAAHDLQSAAEARKAAVAHVCGRGFVRRDPAAAAVVRKAMKAARGLVKPDVVFGPEPTAPPAPIKKQSPACNGGVDKDAAQSSAVGKPAKLGRSKRPRAEMLPTDEDLATTASAVKKSSAKVSADLPPKTPSGNRTAHSKTVGKRRRAEASASS